MTLARVAAEHARTSVKRRPEHARTSVNREKKITGAAEHVRASVKREARNRLLLIEQKAKRHGIPMRRVLIAAKVCERTWWRRHFQTPRRHCIERLERAVDRLARATPPLPEKLLNDHRLLLALVARESGSDPAEILAMDFSTQRPANRAWLEAVRLRRFAIWLACTYFEIDRVPLAETLGCSRQAIKQAIDWVTAQREDPDTNALLTRVARNIGVAAP